ncbi:hypothetical protein INR49_013448 [Caranx melampygus]|nr:hypothetical protein INR49_013448 [Caranx melampygus]
MVVIVILVTTIIVIIVIIVIIAIIAMSSCHHDYSGYRHHMHDFDDEMNGIVTTISTHSRAKRRKEPAATPPPAPPATELTVTPSSPSGSEPKPEASPPEPTNWCLTVLATVRKVLRSINCCHVENPHHIDNYSRVTFPLSFVMVQHLSGCHSVDTPLTDRRLWTVPAAPLLLVPTAHCILPVFAVAERWWNILRGGRATRAK